MIKLTANEKTVLCLMVCNTNSWCESIDFNKDEWMFVEDYFASHIDLAEISQNSNGAFNCAELKGVVSSLIKKDVIRNIGMNGDCNGFYFYKRIWAELKTELKDTMNAMVKSGVRFN